MRTVTADVEGMEPAGDGAAYAIVAGRRLRLDFALPGERVEAALPEREGDVARVVAVIRPSVHRAIPPCPSFGACGGCMWQHINYDEQLRLKAALLGELLGRALGRMTPEVQPMITGTPAPWGFRNKVHFVFAPASRNGGLVMGHFRRHAIEVLPVEECPVHDPAGNRVAFALRDALAKRRIEGARAGAPSRHERGIARHVVVRATIDPAETLATLVVTRNDASLRPAVRAVLGGPGAPDGLHLNVHDRPGPYLFGRETRRLHGRERARETIGGVSFLVSPTAFFQTNVRAAAAMVDFVLAQSAGAHSALDLYAGAGLFALPLARRGVRVTAVEENGQAVEDGEASRAFNRIPEKTCRFLRGRVEELPRAAVRGLPASPDLVVLDPPRPGCEPGVLDWICGTLRPSRIVYVSCNPEALATDLRLMLARGFRAQIIQPIDMFPHTPHIETVAVLSA